MAAEQKLFIANDYPKDVKDDLFFGHRTDFVSLLNQARSEFPLHQIILVVEPSDWLMFAQGSGTTRQVIESVLDHVSTLIAIRFQSGFPMAAEYRFGREFYDSREDCMLGDALSSCFTSNHVLVFTKRAICGRVDEVVKRFISTPQQWSMFIPRGIL
jgi:hypothetical protein